MLLDNQLSGVPLRFTVPEALHEIPLDEEPAQRVTRTFQALSDGLRGTTEEERLHLALAQEMVVDCLRREGAVYLAMGVARSESYPTRLSTAQFSILVKEADLSGSQPLRSLADGLRSPREPREVILNEFAAGEAVVVGEELAVHAPTTATGRALPQTHRVRQAQVIFAFPDNRRIAVLSLSSEHIDDWTYYMEMLNRIAHSVAFTKPSTGSITERLGG